MFKMVTTEDAGCFDCESDGEDERGDREYRFSHAKFSAALVLTVRLVLKMAKSSQADR